nr:hypothetical protein GCM10020093_097990 [Planobispora longispora]
MLLRRTDLPVVAAVERVLGLNAQDPNLPYLALWSRLERFAIKDLTAAIEDRSLVRSTMMRATQHLLSVPDFRLVRPALEPLLRRVQRNVFGRRTAGVDLDALVAEARELLGGRVLTRPQLGRLLAGQRPGADPTALGWTVQYLPDFDATLLAHADRTRMMTDQIRRRVCVGDAVAAVVLVDGTVAATWTRSRTGETAVLTVRPFFPLSISDRDAVEAEAGRLLAFTDPDASECRVRLFRES